MSKENEAILVHDGQEGWCVQPEDAAYQLVKDLQPDKDGIVHVTPGQLDKVKGWWYDKAIQKVEEFIAALNIPWESLELTDEQIQQAEANDLAEKLAKTAHYQIVVTRELARVGTRVSLAKSALEQAIGKALALNDNKGAIGPRSALIISQDRRLRSAKIEIMEAEAYKQALERLEGALELQWKTTSRVLSARMREPID